MQNMQCFCAFQTEFKQAACKSASYVPRKKSNRRSYRPRVDYQQRDQLDHDADHWESGDDPRVASFRDAQNDSILCCNALTNAQL